MEKIKCSNDEVSFGVGFCGHSGHLRLQPFSSSSPSYLPDFVLPPAFPQETTESVKEYLEENYLTPELNHLEPHTSGKLWDFEWFEKANIPLEPSAPRHVIAPSWELPFRRSSPNWKPASTQIQVEELMEGAQEDVGGLNRMPGPAKDFVRGGLNNRPFRPGGFQSSSHLHEDNQNSDKCALYADWVRELIHPVNEGGTLPQTVPPTFREGLQLGPFKEYPSSQICSGRKSVSDEVSMRSTSENLDNFSVRFDDLFKKAFEDDDVIIDKNSHEEITVEKINANPTDIITEIDSQGEINVEQIETADAKSETDTHIGITEVEGEGDAKDLVPETQASLDQILKMQPQEKTEKIGKPANETTAKQDEAWALAGGNEDIINHFYELVPDMAIDFPFELDKFQKEAIYYLEKGESVFVAAHTSAGKTVIAEYAFALSSKHCTRAIYTAPIKTISNQKYRDFCGKFDVGLLTGDVSIKPEASCLIMTTEILRSMLYRGADIIRDIEWVIFDEVHYVNDAERGVVWEEVIIMLPKHINIILLSATVPNTVEFADWIGRTKRKKIRVTSTTKRPVPLEHCIFYAGELYTICEKDVFLQHGYKATKEAFKKKTAPNNTVSSKQKTHLPSSSGRGGVAGGRGQKQKQQQQQHKLSSTSGQQSSGGPKRASESSSWLLLINKLKQKSLLPVVIFCFSKNRCDKSADMMYATDLTSHSEKSEIRLFCDKAFSRLKGSDRELPQVIRIQGLLKRGIGVHHAGLLPIVKEVVEMLFCRGVIKVLFSTETFAMGVNAPARTVVFDSLRKFDGKEFRKLLAGEYIQMAGRAGRRGLDNIGTVIVMCRDDIPEESDLKNLIVGKPTRLESQFRLTYTMILHLLRVEDLKVEDMLKRSFAEFHAQKNLPEKQKELLQKLGQPVKDIECIKGDPEIEEYYDMAVQAETYREAIAEALMQSTSAQQFLSPGRIVVVKSQSGEEHLLGVVLKSPSPTFKNYLVLVLTTESPTSTSALIPSSMQSVSNRDQLDTGANFPGRVLAPKSKRGMDDEYFVTSSSTRKGTGAVNIEVPKYGVAAGVSYAVKQLESNTKEIISICQPKMKIDQVKLLEEPSDAVYSRTIQQLVKYTSEGGKFPPALDPIKDLKLKDMSVVEQYRKYNKLLQKLTENKCHGCIKFKEHFSLIKEQKRHKEEVTALEFLMSDEALQQMPDFQGRIDVLKEINCIDEDLVVQLKGRVACEMNSGEELICTECLFENQFDDLEPEEAVAVMSALVFQQNNTSEPSLTPKLSLATKRLYDTAIRLGELQAQFKVAVDPQDYARDNLKFGLVEVVYEWARGTPFAEICELTDVSEGLIVRTIVRLDETCREFRNAAAIMGNSTLFKKMEAASNAIKRDIVFAASLYVTGV
ncbi:ATP-dependent RNA helicase [Rhynchospora pubera]|uniref:ATP-dependent RNA helicase n=1 Tax=Rhynchospora pubera TaxID=906938 RepID=A0AAV8ER70_9POAL|nr:ATP-dependent RNA helicase [Rhynchospora pubera]